MILMGKLFFRILRHSGYFGYSFDEIEGVLIHEVIHKQQPDGTFIQAWGEPSFLMAIASGNDYNNDDGVFTCKSGFLMPISFVCRAVFKDDTLDGAVIAFRDITEQKKHLRSLEAINELLEKQATHRCTHGNIQSNEVQQNIDK